MILYNLVSKILNFMFKFLRDLVRQCFWAFNNRLPWLKHKNYVCVVQVSKRIEQMSKKILRFRNAYQTQSISPRVSKYIGWCKSWSGLNIEPCQWSLPLPLWTISGVSMKKSAMFLASLFQFPNIRSKSSRNNYIAEWVLLMNARRRERMPGVKSCKNHSI